jgi:hypothetical protein
VRNLLAALAASAVLIGGYGALGGADYRPATPADPCKVRGTRGGAGVDVVIEEIALASVDGAACALKTSSESLVLALTDDANRAAFRSEHGLSDVQIDAAVHEALLRGIDQAEARGTISPFVADRVRTLTNRVPAGQVIGLIQSLATLVSP